MNGLLSYILISFSMTCFVAGWGTYVSGEIQDGLFLIVASIPTVLFALYFKE